MMNKYKLVGAFLIALLSGVEVIAQTYNWSPAGPVLSAGRSRNMVVDRNNKNVLYVGSVSSGIFKSTDAGANWAPLDDQGSIRNISYLAQAADGTIYASTGEGFLRVSARQRALIGTGLYKLLPNNTLQLVMDSSVLGTVITRIACHPSDASKIAVAGNKGLFLSSDGGTSFTKASGSIAPTATALTVSYDVQGNVYVTTTSVTTGGGVRMYKSDSGNPAGFNDITPTSSFLPNSNYGRIEFAVSSNNSSVVYASIAKPTNPGLNVSSASLYGFFVSKDGGQSWILILEGSPQLDPLSSGGSTNSGDYAHCVLINPLNDDQVFVGSYKFYLWAKNPSAAEGVGTWTRFGNELFFNTPIYLRQNIHDIKITTTGNNFDKFYFTTEAGIYRSADGLTTFQPYFKGLGTAQYNSISIGRYPKSANTNSVLTPYSNYIAATAGNGVSYFSGNYPAVTTEFNYLTGDIMNVEFSKLSPNSAFLSNSTGNLYVASDVLINEPILMQASHLGSKCNTEPSITQIDFRGITNGGTTTDDVYTNNSYSVIGTPFKLWESVKTYSIMEGPLVVDKVNSIDSTIFFNDSVRVLIPLTNTIQTVFTLDLIKPQKSAIIDKVIIQTFTTGIQSAESATCQTFAGANSEFTLSTKASMEFNGAPNATTVPTPSNIILTGLATSTANSLFIIANESRDEISFQLPNNPCVLNPAYTTTASIAAAKYKYINVGVTVYYRYNAGSRVYLSNNDIPSITFKDSFDLASPLTWTFNDVATSSIVPVSAAPPIKRYAPVGSRLAVLNDKGVLISKRSLSTNDPQKFQPVSCTGALTTNSGTYTAGQMTVTGLPYLLEWAPDGKSLYYVTSVTTPTATFRVYKVNLGASIHDFSINDYRGAFYTGCVTSKRNTATAFSFTTNFNSPFRTTLIGTFSERITNLAVSDNSKTLLLTTADKTGPNKRIYVSTPNIDLQNVDNTVITFTDKTGNLPAIGVNCALFEMTDNKRVFIGTDNGVYVTEDITVASPNWNNANNSELPNVQVFDLKQQKLERWQSYNSGVIYVATNGRGAWINKNYLSQTVIGVEENEVIAKNTGLSLYPNPTNGDVNLNFYAANNENVIVNILDINGRVVKSEPINNLYSGYKDYKFNTNELSNGVYIVNISSSLGIKRYAKLIVSK